MGYRAALLLFGTLSACSSADSTTGIWVNRAGMYYDDTLIISKKDTGIICTTHHGKHLMSQNLLTNELSFQREFRVGCMAYDLNYIINYSPKTHELIVSTISNDYSEDEPVIRNYSKVTGLSPSATKHYSKFFYSKH